MNTVAFERIADLANGAFSISGIPMPPDMGGNIGTAMHCLSPEAEAEGRVQRRRNLKEHWRPRLRRGNRLLSEKATGFI